jgi:small multidrug resistance pump
MKEWLFLILAILFEVVGTTSMKLSKGFSETIPSIAVFLFYILSLSCLTIAIKNIDISIAYAVWSGLGTATIVLIGIIFFKEPVTALKIAAIFLITIGVIVLNIHGGGH